MPAFAANQARGIRCQSFVQQSVQGLDKRRLRSNFLPGRQLIEHVDQRFLGGVCLMEEPFADRQAAFFNGAIQVEQGLAQAIDGLQVQQVRRLGQGGQLVEQGVEPVPLVGILAPVAQRVFSVKQSVHAFAQKLGNTLRITLAFNSAVGRIEQRLKTPCNLLLKAIDQVASAMNIGQRIIVELFKAPVQQRLGLRQQLDFIQLQTKVVRLVFPYQKVQRHGQFGHAQHTGHVGAAFECVHGKLQLIAGIQRQLFTGLIKKAI